MAKSEFASDVTWERVRSIWWAFFWRAAIYSTLLGFVLGFVGGVVIALLGRADLGASVGGALGSIGAIPVSLVVMSMVLKKRYGSFSVRLLPHNTAS